MTPVGIEARLLAAAAGGNASALALLELIACRLAPECRAGSTG